ALVVTSYVVTSRAGDVGTTTEVAAVITVLAGALCYWGLLQLAVAIAVATAVMLSAKLELRRFVARLRGEDIVATLKFAVVTAILLPVFPDHGVGVPPFDVLNPYKIWLMVVLISAIGFVGYVLIQIVGPRRGIGLTGVLGGLVSSTAVTWSFAQRSRDRERLARSLALAIVVAWSMMFARVLVAVTIVSRPLLASIWFAMVVALAAGIAYATWIYFSERSPSEEEVTFENPFEIGPAVRFGLLYGAILLMARTAQLYLGNRGVYLSALVTGLVDVDAITLSLAELSRSGDTLSELVAGRAVVLAAMANTAFKGGIVLATGSAALKRAIWPGMALILSAAFLAAFV
ncbi:MAG: MgtC/SapB family protein, partial [Vicinamibacteria bacterium]